MTEDTTDTISAGPIDIFHLNAVLRFIFLAQIKNLSYWEFLYTGSFRAKGG